MDYTKTANLLIISAPLTIIFLGILYTALRSIFKFTVLKTLISAIAVILITSLIYLSLGWRTIGFYFIFILTGAIVCFVPAKILHETLVPKVNLIVLAPIIYLAITLIVYTLLSLTDIYTQEEKLTETLSILWPVFIFGKWWPGLSN